MEPFAAFGKVVYISPKVNCENDFISDTQEENAGQYSFPNL